jgi:long-chain acyl-CoA synthetase
MMLRVVMIIMEMRISSEDRWLNAMPIFHIGVVESLGVMLRCGTNIVLRDFVPEDFCRLVEQEKATKTFITPAVINSVLNSPGSSERDLTSLDMILYGAAPMPLTTLRRVTQIIPGCDLIQAYGTSECWALVYLSPAEHRAALAGVGEEADKLRAIGRKGLLSEAKVVRDDGTPVAPGEVGEILLKSGAIMSGYLNKPEETARAIRDGWFYTKDLATVDTDGYIYIVDRKNHMIITGGENVYPAQVERALFDHPGIAEAAVIGVPDTTWGEAVKALVVLKPGQNLSEKEVIEFCAPKMASYAKPKSVEFLPHLPHTATGKVDKLCLKKKYWHGRDRMIG